MVVGYLNLGVVEFGLCIWVRGCTSAFARRIQVVTRCERPNLFFMVSRTLIIYFQVSLFWRKARKFCRNDRGEPPEGLLLPDLFNANPLGSSDEYASWRTAPTNNVVLHTPSDFHTIVHLRLDETGPLGSLQINMVFDPWVLLCVTNEKTEEEIYSLKLVFPKLQQTFGRMSY